ncbi:MAG: hypothetical protein JRH20_07255 [Deltaproteobacteria bacterium]|nr:hypothetical protein [Deltaproteobacteria bacterium]
MSADFPSPNTPSPAQWIQPALRVACACAQSQNEGVRDTDALLEMCLNLHAQGESGGSLTIEVEPERLLHAEQSLAPDVCEDLAARLYGDGLRRIIITGVARQDDIVALIEVFALRLLDPPEDDISTLAAARISSRIIFDRSGAPLPKLSAESVSPKEWDVPLAQLSTQLVPSHRVLASDTLSALRQEAASLPCEGTAQLAREVLLRVDDSVAARERCVTLLVALAQLHLAGGHLRELVQLLERAKQALGAEEMGPLSFVDAMVMQGRVLDHLVDAHHKISGHDMAALLAYAGEGMTDGLLMRFSAETQPARRGRLKAAIVGLASSRPELILDRLGDLGNSERAAELFNVICITAPPERLMDAAYGLLGEDEPDLQLAALEVIAADSASPRLEDACVQLLESPLSAVRQRAAGILGRKGSHKVVDGLLATAERLARGRNLEDVEATHLGRAVGRAAAEPPELLFKWVKPPSLLTRGKRAYAARQLRWVAVSALSQVATKRAQKGIEQAKGRADEAFRAHCEAALKRAANIAKERAEDLLRTRPLCVVDIEDEAEAGPRVYGSARRKETPGDGDE